MSWLEIDNELLNEVEAEKVSTGNGVLASGVYNAKIVQAFLRKTDSGATMFELECESLEGKKIFWNTCVKSGDAKGNKATYTDQKTGKEKLLPGVTQVIHLFESIGKEMTKEEPQSGKIEYNDKTIEAGIFKSLTGSRFTACIRQYEDEYNGEIKIKYDIEHFLDQDGKNSKGEDLTSKFEDKIAKSPIKLLKKQSASANAQAQQAEAVASGW